MDKHSAGMSTQAGAPRRKILLRAVVTLLTTVLLGAIAPAIAAAAEYTVNSTGDQTDESPGTGGCKTAANTCTLRAAIEESNASTGVTDTIKFDFSSFDGQIADTIELGSSLPTITDRVTLEGYPRPQKCETDYFEFPGPCVGIDGPPGETAFRVAAERVVLIGFAISGAKTAVEAVGAPGLEVWNDWFGLMLDGTAGPIETGISIDQNSNGPLIGLTTNVVNIFAHDTNTGLEIEGADYATVSGNGFGVLPDGSSLAPNGNDIEIADAASGQNRVARGNWIGGTYPDEDPTSTICDVYCNVISGATEAGIDLSGDGPNQDPASGSTRIFGNYIGLNAFGTSGVPNAQGAISVGSAENVTIGGPHPGDRNMINGGADGIFAGPNAGNLAIEGNWIGLDPSGTKMLAAPTARGIAIESGYQDEISNNRIAMPSGTAIEQGAPEAVVHSNTIGRGVDGQDLPGASVGIHLLGSCFSCNLVYDNTIANAAENGVLVETSRNLVYGNRIEGSGAAGIRIKDPGPFGVTRNVIGGNRTGEENTISESGGAAIEIILVTPFGINTRNEVARNHGELNGGPFIDLVNGGNGEISPPVFVSSTPSGASGTALPGATIRIFRKANSSPGELEGFLSETTADEAGDWDVTYPAPVASGTIVAATQTRLIVGTATPEPADGTSELAFSTTTAEPEERGSGGGNGSATPPRDTTPPDTTIFKRVLKRRPPIFVFSFQSTEPGSTFECKLDNHPFAACSSPKTYMHLKSGQHSFAVVAVDSAGNKDPTPAVVQFTFPQQTKHPHAHRRRHEHGKR
jgi:CSLREA domain-containing protein